MARSLPFSIAFAALVCAPAGAQDFDGRRAAAALLKKDVPPAPRLPDGRPDLGNSKGSWNPPGVGDMAGTGGGSAGSAKPEKVVDVPFLPWAKTAYDQRNANLAKDDPEGFCLPPGGPRLFATAFPFQIYQMPGRILFVFEGGAHMWRVVYMDGRKHTPPDKLNPTYLGESIGHWEGDTLVVETINFSPKRNFFGSNGTFTLVDRFTRIADDAIVHTYTVEDPATWTRPWTVELPMHRINGPMLEYACNENNEDIFSALRNARAQEQGKLPPPDTTKNVDDAKARIIEREEKKK
jgi:hypothetical protein